MTDEPLTDTTALVTGSSRNLGAAIARELALRGSRVIITYHTHRDDAEALAERLSAETGRHHPALHSDLSSGDSIRAFLARFSAEVGHADILVNNTGPFAMDPFENLTEETWDRIWDSNVKAAYLCAQALAPGMRRRGWGRIVNISAGSAFRRDHSIYTLAKQALVTLTESLALELGPEVTVNAVAPGQIAESASDMAAFDPDFVQRAIEQTPTGRLVTRQEVARIVAELCGPTYDSVTGVTIPVDGGGRLPRF